MRPGGAWRATMVQEEDGTELPFRGEYREVVEPAEHLKTQEGLDD